MANGATDTRGASVTQDSRPPSVLAPRPPREPAVERPRRMTSVQGDWLRSITDPDGYVHGHWFRSPDYRGLGH